MDLHDPGWAKVLSDWAQFIVAALIGAVTALWGTLGKRDRALTDRVDAVRRDLDSNMAEVRAGIQRLETLHQTQPNPKTCGEQMARIARLESTVVAGPSHRDIAHAHKRMDGHGEALAEIKGGVKRIEHTVDMLSQYLLEHGPRAQED